MVKFYSFLIGVIVVFGCNDTIVYPPGGYTFPTSVNPKDSNEYFYVLKDKLSLRDSLVYHDEHYFFQVFDEPNLSQQPAKHPIVRLVFQSIMTKSYVIILTEEKLVVKKAVSGEVYPGEDLNKLDQTERLHYSILRYHFPLQPVVTTSNYGHRIAWYIKTYPKLTDPNYYRYLWLKVKGAIREPLKVETKEIAISSLQYKRLIGLINSSGYWQSNNHVECDVPINDGYVFSLEVNTTKKYNVVAVESCPLDSSKLTRACQQIVEMAGLGKMIHLTWEPQNNQSDTVQVEPRPVKIMPIKE